MPRIARVLLVLMTLGTVACGGRGPGGPTPLAADPQISCPLDVTLRGVESLTETLVFDLPGVTGGTTPVQTACDPASGSAFPLGTTRVSCSARDAASRMATCSFQVIVTGLSIALTKYAAFGDSVTAGETGRPTLRGFNEIDVPNAYPTKLQQRFDAYYPGQGIVVVNRGHSSDTAAQTDALIRTLAATDQPEVVLLLTGYNNLTQACGSSGAGAPSCRDAIRSVGVGVRDCIRHAREVARNLRFVFVSTLTPSGAVGSNRIDPRAIAQANDEIRRVAVSEQAVLVDSYSAFLGHEVEYVNADGLHLKPAGYEALADGFFAAIRATVEQTALVRGR